MSSLTPGLSIIHSNRLEHLRQVVVEWIKSHPLGVLDTEQFIVQSNGMAQWLKLALADDAGCGISAGLEMQLPGRYVWTAYRAVLGDDIPEISPYDKERIKWRLFRLLPDLGQEAVFAPLNRFLEGDGENHPNRQERRLSQLAARLADLFDQYQVYRADWLADWAAGRDRLARIGGPPADLPSDQYWQAELWRRIRADIPESLRSISRSDLHQEFVKQAMALRAKRPGSLPPRVMVFGICSLPRQVIETLHAVSGFCQVLLFVQNPCRHFWADIIEDRELLRISNARHQLKENMPAPLDPGLLHQHANPLLAAWGKQGRDYIGLLYGYDAPETYEKEFSQIDLFEDFAGKGSTSPLLHQIQQAVLDLTPLPQTRDDRSFVSADDPSIRFAVAHSRQREVEILQDRLLYYFETLEGLTPGDIMVMAADIDAYGPHIEAVFGNMPAGDERFIPFTIADKPERESLPLVAAIETLLSIPDARMGMSDIIDLLEVPAFRAGFGLTSDDLPRLVRWIEGAGICWGLTPDQRESFGMPPGLDQNTWAFGLDRMLLGYAVGQGQAWEGIEPYGEVGGLDAALVGPLSDLIREMEHLRTTLANPGSPADWCKRIRQMIQICFLAQEDRDLITFNRLEEVLDSWLDACSQAGMDQKISLSVVRELVMENMAVAGVSQRFLAGMVNFGTLMPMRAIPFRVVCLLGMNDGEFPRSHPPLDFDLMSGKGLYRPGDRSRREDDRYLFLEALLSARERLYISHVGRDIRDNSERMPSVLVGQLRDYLSTGWQLEGDRDGLVDHLTTVYPLQPFSRAYFTGDDAGSDRPGIFTYAREWRNALDPSDSHEQEIRPLAPPREMIDPSLSDLTRFMKNPVTYFFNRRLSVRLDETGESVTDTEPFVLDGLAPFGLGNRLLEAGLAVPAETARDTVAAEARRMMRTGELPMAGFGRLAADTLARTVNDMLARHHALLARWPDPLDPVEISCSFKLDMKSGQKSRVRLDDWLDRIYGHGASDCCARWEFYPKIFTGKTVTPEQLYTLVGLWVRHLAGAAAGYDMQSALVTPKNVIVLPSLVAKEARRLLNDLVFQWYRGLTLPLPVTAKTGLTHAAMAAKGSEKAFSAARKVYEGDGFNFAGELGYDACLRRVYPSFQDLWAAFDNEFVRLSKALYAPLANLIMNID